MRWIAAAVCVLVFLAIGLLSTRNTPRTLSEAGCTVPAVSDRPDAYVCFPAMGAEPSDYFQIARETCARARVDPLATMFKTEPKPETVARDYSLWVRATLKQDEPRVRAVYEGCLEGFRD